MTRSRRNPIIAPKYRVSELVSLSCRGMDLNLFGSVSFFLFDKGKGGDLLSGPVGREGVILGVFNKCQRLCLCQVSDQTSRHNCLACTCTCLRVCVRDVGCVCVFVCVSV